MQTTSDNILCVDVMWKETHVANIIANLTKENVKIKNFTDDLLNRPFGNNEKPTFKEFEEFLEDRCFPRERHNKKEILRCLGLEFCGYDPLEIVRKTHGVMFEDFIWLKFEGECIGWCDVKMRD